MRLSSAAPSRRSQVGVFIRGFEVLLRNVEASIIRFFGGMLYYIITLR